tara:strand:+ start:12230 stop:13489 length:1260 start_codon:yes stop_codon:yes gene_type:complete
MDFGVVRFLTFGTLFFRFVIGLALAGDCLDLGLVIDDAGPMAIATHFAVHVFGGGGSVRVAIQLTLTAPPIVLASFTMLPAVVTGSVGSVVVQTVAHIIRAVIGRVARAMAAARVFVDATAIKRLPGIGADTLGGWSGQLGTGLENTLAMPAAGRRQFQTTRTEVGTVCSDVVRITDTFQSSFETDLANPVARTRLGVGGPTGLLTTSTKIVVVAHTLQRTADGLTHPAVLRTVVTTQTALAPVSGGEIPGVAVATTGFGTRPVATADIADATTGSDFFALGTVRAGQRLGPTKRVALGAIVVFLTSTDTSIVCRRLGVALVAGDADPFLVIWTLTTPSRIHGTVSAHATQPQMFALTIFTKFTAKDSFRIFTATFAVGPDGIVLAGYNNIVNVPHKVIDRHGKQSNQGCGEQHAETID